MSRSTATAVLVAVLIFFGLGLHTVFNINKSKLVGNPTVPGENYQICGANASTYLTSPWTYHSLASGMQDYTVSQYEALSGYGTTLPPLPSYISGQASSTEAAEIVAPGATVNNLNTPESPIIYFFEGGAYGELDTAAVNGDEYIGGSNGSYGEPLFSNAGDQGGINDWNASYDTPSALATIAGSSALPVGTTTFNLTASRLPIVPGEVLDISGNYYPVQSVSGTQSGYTVTLQSNSALGTSIAAGTSVTYFNEFAGGVTVQYLSIDDDLGTPATITSGAQWTIENNKIYNGVDQGTGEGMAIYDASVYFQTTPDNISYTGAYLQGGTIEYNCLENEGHSGIHEFGHDSTFDYNEVTDVASDTSAANNNTGDAGDKWWNTLNSTILDNYFSMDDVGDAGDPIWFDDGNTGFLVQGNYFYGDYGGALDVETGFNGDINDNMFVDNGWGATNSSGNPSTDGAIELNQTGAWNIPGSNYNDELLVQNNILTDNWENITIWNAGSRSCQNPQEQAGSGDWDNSSYCTGGFPNGDNNFSIYNYAENDANWGTLTNAASTGATTLYVNNLYAPKVGIGDYIGFSSPGQSGYPLTNSTSTVDVTSFTGTQSLTVASTTGFPSSGNIQTAVSSANAEGSVVGATFSYSGISGNNLEDVSLINPSLYSSSTHLVSGGYVMAFEPYKITAETGSNPYTEITISPGLSTNESAGANIYNDGTCYDDLTSAATPSSPVAPDGTSYFDGCMWEARNITIEDNTESFTPSDITGGSNLWNSTAYQSCVSGSSSGACGTNFEEYQAGYYPGGTAAGPYYIYQNEMEDAFMANPNFETPITSHWLGAPSGNDGETAWNITWTGNTYNGPIYFYAGPFGTCNLPSPWSCFVNASTWDSTASGGWANDQAGSSYPDPSTPTNVTAHANSPTSVTTSWSASTDSGGPGLGGYYIFRNGTQIGSTNSTTTSYTDTTASPDTSYSYTVEAYDTADPPNASTASSAADITTPNVLPTIPTNVSAMANSQTRVTVTWTASTDTGGPGLGGYDIFRGGTQIGTAGSSATSYMDNTTSPGVSYSYTVEAYDTNNNESGQSLLPAMVTTPSGCDVPLYRLYDTKDGDHLYTTDLSEVVGALQANYVSESIVGYVDQTNDGSETALYRLRQLSTGFHFYTTSSSEEAALVASNQYVSEGITGYVASSSGTGVSEFYRLYNSRYGLHFYTDSTAEVTAAEAAGYTSEGNAGYVYTAMQSICHSPLYRLYNPRNGDHLYTVAMSETDSALASGLSLEGTAGYVDLSNQSGDTALYRLRQLSTGFHFYTTSSSEEAALVASNQYVSEGITGYVASSSGTGVSEFYRLYNSRYGLHFYTDSTAEVTAAEAAGYTSEGNAGYVYLNF